MFLVGFLKVKSAIASNVESNVWGTRASVTHLDASSTAKQPGQV